MTFAGHVALFPGAATALRDNLPNVAPHNPAQKLIEGLAEGLTDTVTTMKWQGLISGTAMPGGTAAPIVFTLPAAPASAAAFLALSGWMGVSAALFAQSVIQNMLLNVAVIAKLYGDPSTAVGTGSAIFPNPAYAAALQSALNAHLLGTLSAALTATGAFCRDDVPGGPLNPTMAESIPYYASAYAQGLATLVAVVPYVGGASSSASTGVVTGSVR
tara:strand:+ start:549 stop:1196 length:648 start_codon:yes stop_codon:yes gene_type:complete